MTLGMVRHVAPSGPFRPLTSAPPPEALYDPSHPLTHHMIPLTHHMIHLTHHMIHLTHHMIHLTHHPPATGFEVSVAPLPRGTMPVGVTDTVAIGPTRALLRHVDGHVALATWTDGGQVSLARVTRRAAEKSAGLNAEIAEIASALPPAAAASANLATSADLGDISADLGDISADLAVSAGGGSFGARLEISRILERGSGLVLAHPRENDGGTSRSDYRLITA